LIVNKKFLSIHGAKNTAPTDNLPTEVAKFHNSIADSECTPDITEKSQAFAFNSSNTIYLVPCIQGAYQVSYRGYIVANSLDRIQQVMVLAASGKDIVATTDLMGADYNSKTKTLTTLAKSRGFGDCGQSSISKVAIHGYNITVRTTEVRSKYNCDGKVGDNWPVVFKQD
jgi:hypothetical protein